MEWNGCFAVELWVLMILFFNVSLMISVFSAVLNDLICLYHESHVFLHLVCNVQVAFPLTRSEDGTEQNKPKSTAE